MPPGWLKKRGSLRDVENVSTRKLSVRLKSDKARESAADKVKRRASQSTGTSGIRHYGEVELEVEKEILGYFTERAPAKKALEPWRTNLRKPIKLDPLPAPELPRVSGYPAHARGDEWQRVVGSIDDEALTVPGHHAGLDEASELAKTKFLARAKRAVMLLGVAPEEGLPALLVVAALRLEVALRLDGEELVDFRERRRGLLRGAALDVVRPHGADLLLLAHEVLELGAELGLERRLLDLEVHLASLAVPLLAPPEQRAGGGPDAAGLAAAAAVLLGGRPQAPVLARAQQAQPVRRPHGARTGARL